MQYSPIYQVIDGVRAAFFISTSSDDEAAFEDWLEKYASMDGGDGGNRVVAFSAELVTHVVRGMKGNFLAADPRKQVEVVRAHQVFESLDMFRGIATDWR